MKITPCLLFGVLVTATFSHLFAAAPLVNSTITPTLGTLRDGPMTPPVEVIPGESDVQVNWTPTTGTANFLQYSNDLKTWRYFPESICGPRLPVVSDPPIVTQMSEGSNGTRDLIFPLVPGAQFFRAVTLNYTGSNPSAEDFDGDGILTHDELVIFGTDPLRADTDGDGMADGAADSDSDGIPDFAEILAGLNPHDASDAALDFDRDGISNLSEHLGGTNPGSADTDGDSLTDDWELLYGDPKVFSNPKLDADGDGLTAYTEQQLGTNPNVADSDSNGVTDGAQDSDGDGISNFQEQTASTNPASYFNDSNFTTFAVLTGDNQSVSAGETSTTITLKFTDPTTGAPFSNAPVYIFRSCMGKIAGNSQPRVDFITAPDGTISFTFETLPWTLSGASPLHVGVALPQSSGLLGRVEFQVIPASSASSLNSGNGTLKFLAQPTLSQNSLPPSPAPAIFPRFIKLATIQVQPYKIPRKICFDGKILFDAGQNFWDGAALKPFTYSGSENFLLYGYSIDMNSKGDFVGTIPDYTNSSTQGRKEFAIYGNLKDGIIKKYTDTPLNGFSSYVQLSENRISVPYFNESYYFDESWKYIRNSSLKVIDDNGTAYGIQENLGYSREWRTRESNYWDFKSNGIISWSDIQGSFAYQIPSSFSTQTGAWISFLRGFSNLISVSSYDGSSHPSGQVIAANLVSPNGSKLIFNEENGNISYRSIPYLGPLSTLPTYLVGVNDAGVIVGGRALPYPYDTIPANPLVFLNNFTVMLPTTHPVIGVSNNKLDQPITVFGTRGVWVQKTDQNTRLPLDLSNGTNVFEYKTYNQLDATSNLGLTNITANCVDKQGTTLAIQGINAVGQIEHQTVLLVPLEVVSRDKFLAGSFSIPSSWDSLQMEFVGPNGSLGKYGNLLGGGSTKIYDKVEDIMADPDYAAGGQVDTQKVWFVKDSTDSRKINYYTCFDSTGEIKIKLYLNGKPEAFGEITHNLTAAPDFAAVIDYVDKWVKGTSFNFTGGVITPPLTMRSASAQSFVSEGIHNLTRAALIPFFNVVNNVEGLGSVAFGLFDGIKEGVSDDYKLLVLIKSGVLGAGGWAIQAAEEELNKWKNDPLKRAAELKKAADRLCQEWVFKPMEAVQADLSTWEGFKNRSWQTWKSVEGTATKAWVLTQSSFESIKTGLSEWVDDFADRMMEGAEKAHWSEALLVMDKISGDANETTRQASYTFGYTFGYVGEQAVVGLLTGGSIKIGAIMTKGGAKVAGALAARRILPIVARLQFIKKWAASAAVSIEMKIAVERGLTIAAEAPLSALIKDSVAEVMERGMKRATFERTAFSNSKVLDEVLAAPLIKKLILAPGRGSQFWYKFALFFEVMGDKANAPASKGWVKAYNRLLKFDGDILMDDRAGDFFTLMRMESSTTGREITRKSLAEYSVNGGEKLWVRDLHTLQTKGYRYVNQYELNEIAANGGKLPLHLNREGQYFTLEGGYANGAAAKNALQLPRPAGEYLGRIEFDIAPVKDKIRVPRGENDTAEFFEPLTRDFGEFGEFGLGGGPQLLLDSEEVPVIFKAFGTF